MGNGPFGNARIDGRGLWQAGALWRRRVGILLTTAAFAGTAFGLCSILVPGEPSTRLVVMDRGPVSSGSAARSIGEVVSAAGGALTAGFKASAELMSGLDPNEQALSHLSEILRSAPAGSLVTEAGATDFTLAARDVLPLGIAGADVKPRIVADVTVPTEHSISSPALLTTALAGLVGLLASSFAAVSDETKVRRLHRARNRWDAPGQEESASRQEETALTTLFETSPVDAEAKAETFDLRRDAAVIGADEVLVADATGPAMNEGAFVASGDAMDVPMRIEPPLQTTAAADALRMEPLASHSNVSGAAAEGLHAATILALPRALSTMPSIEADDVAEAALSVGVRAILVVEASEGRRTCGSVDLLRALAARDATSILVDLGFDRVIADDLGIEKSALGLSEFLTGTVDVAPIIHRDAASRADAIVWGRDGDVGPIRSERLDDLFATLGKVYDCIVIAGGATSPANLRGFLGEEGAIIVSTRFGEADAAENRMAGLADQGAPQLLTMSAYPRMLHRMAEAA